MMLPSIAHMMLPSHASQDKITKSPDHRTLPKWDIKQDTLEKYRGPNGASR